MCDPISAIAIGSAVIGAGTSIFGASQANSANQEMLAAQQQAEKIRYEAMQADAERKRRESIRRGIILQHQGIANETAQGANESSAAYGVTGQVSQETAWNVAGINEQEHFGKGLFQANEALFQGKSDLANAQTISQIGSGLSSLGNTFLSQGPTIRNLMTPSVPTTGSWAGVKF